MKLWPFRKQKNAPASTGPVATSASATTGGTTPTGPMTIVPFPGDIEDTATLKYHGVRALGAFLMDRHSACRQPHPFCGPQGHYKSGDTPAQLVAHVIPQLSESGDDLIAIYLCKAQGGITSTDDTALDPLIYTAWLNCFDPASREKIVAQLQSDGSYWINYGPILNPVEDNHSTGRIDTRRSRYSSYNPEPPGIKWGYLEIGIADGMLRLIPSFHCLQVFGEWWVVDTDGEKRAYQQIAYFDYADNPNHDLGVA